MISDCGTGAGYHGRGLCKVHYWAAYNGRLSFPKEYEHGRALRNHPFALPGDVGHPAVRRLFAEMRKQRIALGELARRSGVSYASLHNWRRGNGLKKVRNSPRLDNLEACLNVVGLQLVVRSNWRDDD